MTALAVSWDEWRACYDEWTFADQQDFYDRVFQVAPNQDRFDADRLGRFLDWIGRPVSVGELGGWDGGFAAAVLPDHPQVERWTNYEISRAAVEASWKRTRDWRYDAVALTRHYWETQHLDDVFVASHVIEHLRWADVKRVFDATRADWVYLQAPLGEHGRSWDGYHGSHILEVGWITVMDELYDRGYRLLRDLSNAGCRCFARPT